jgi:hypothetical protein
VGGAWGSLEFRVSRVAEEGKRKVQKFRSSEVQKLKKIEEKYNAEAQRTRRFAEKRKSFNTQGTE